MKALLWDLDDTLLDTLPWRMASLEHAYLACMGSRVDAVALWRSHRGGTLESLGRLLLGDDFRRFTTAYRDHYYSQRRAVQPFAGVEEVLAECVAAGLPMAVVTSKVAWGATEELLESGLLRYFQCVVGFDDTERHKPDPEPILTALERMCIDDVDCVAFVGDSPADIWAARNAGCHSVAALWGTLDAELLTDAMPDFRARTPDDLLEALAQGAVA